MIYATHLTGMPGIQPSFHINVDDETMTWVSHPPGHDINKPITAVFSCGGPIGSSKAFTVFPGGKAQLAKKR